MGIDKGYYSWDIVLDKIDEYIYFFDKRSETEIFSIEKDNFLDLQNVGETSTTNPPPAQKEEYDKETKKNQAIDNATTINLAFPLMVEGAQIYHEIQQGVVDHSVTHELVFEEDEEKAEGEDEEEEELPFGYVYKKFIISDQLVVITKAQVHSYRTKPDETVEFMNLYSFNEWNSKQDWKK